MDIKYLGVTLCKGRGVRSRIQGLLALQVLHVPSGTAWLQKAPLQSLRNIGVPSRWIDSNGDPTWPHGRCPTAPKASSSRDGAQQPLRRLLLGFLRQQAGIQQWEWLLRGCHPSAWCQRGWAVPSDTF